MSALRCKQTCSDILFQVHVYFTKLGALVNMAKALGSDIEDFSGAVTGEALLI